MKKLIPALIVFLSIQNNGSAQVLETEDSRPPNTGQVELGAGLEQQSSKEGYEVALPLSFAHGLSKIFTFLFEPVPFTNIHPKVGRRVSDLGDLEMTLFYQLIKETKGIPSISLFAEVKLPTAKDSLIGTGKTDFTPFIIPKQNNRKIEGIPT